MDNKNKEKNEVQKASPSELANIPPKVVTLKSGNVLDRKNV